MADLYRQKRKPYLMDINHVPISYEIDPAKSYYPFTQTFSAMSVKEKTRYIQSYARHMARFVGPHTCYYTIEYHKNKRTGQPNSFAPHIHGLLICDYPLGQHGIAYLRNGMNKIMGNLLLNPQEDMEEIPGWFTYCKKEFDVNIKFELEQEFMYTVTKPLDPLDLNDYIDGGTIEETYIKEESEESVDYLEL